MREIKFRAWDKERKEIIPDLEDHYIIEIEGYSTLIFGEPLTSKLKINEYIKPERIILMQFTGLKDKNGKEIYEGDIVTIIFDKNWSEKYPDTQDVGEVIFDNGTFCARKGKEKIRAWKDGVHDWHSLENVEELEVIGNIYENPKMVKK